MEPSTNPVQLQRHYWFIHDYYLTIFSGFMRWFNERFHGKLKYKVMATYDKAVEIFNKENSNPNGPYTNILPSITMNPSLDIEPANWGNPMYYYQGLDPDVAGHFNKEIIYQDDRVEVNVSYNRFKGSFEIMFWLESLFEYFNTRINLIQFCNGLNRIIRPSHFVSEIVIPYDIVNYFYENKYEPDSNHNLDLSLFKKNDIGLTPGAYQKIDKPTADTAHFVDFHLSPFVKMTSISNASEIYGGDNIASYKLNATFEYEVAIPVFITLQTDWKLGKIISFDKTDNGIFSRIGIKNEASIINAIERDLENNTLNQTVLIFDKYYKWIATRDYIDEEIIFDVGFNHNNDNLSFIIKTLQGYLQYGTDFEFVSNTEVKILKFNINTGELLEIFYYIRS